MSVRPSTWPAAIALLAVTLAPGWAHAESEDEAYASLPAPAYEVYQAMLNYADDGAFDRLAASLKHLDGLFQALDGCCAQPLKPRLVAAISHADASEVRNRLVELIAVDFRRHLVAASGARDGARLVQELQMAAALYGILSPTVRRVDPVRDARMRHDLKELFRFERSADVAGPKEILLADLGTALVLCPPRRVSP